MQGFQQLACMFAGVLSAACTVPAMAAYPADWLKVSASSSDLVLKDNVQDVDFWTVNQTDVKRTQISVIESSRSAPFDFFTDTAGRSFAHQTVLAIETVEIEGYLQMAYSWRASLRFAAGKSMAGEFLTLNSGLEMNPGSGVSYAILVEGELGTVVNSRSGLASWALPSVSLEDQQMRLISLNAEQRSFSARYEGGVAEVSGATLMIDSFPGGVIGNVTVVANYVSPQTFLVRQEQNRLVWDVVIPVPEPAPTGLALLGCAVVACRAPRFRARWRQ